MSGRIIGVILAAGKGSRIQPLSMSYPEAASSCVQQADHPAPARGVHEALAASMRSLLSSAIWGERIVDYFGDGSALGNAHTLCRADGDAGHCPCRRPA